MNKFPKSFIHLHLVFINVDQKSTIPLKGSRICQSRQLQQLQIGNLANGLANRAATHPLTRRFAPWS